MKPKRGQNIIRQRWWLLLGLALLAVLYLDIRSTLRRELSSPANILCVDNPNYLWQECGDIFSVSCMNVFDEGRQAASWLKRLSSSAALSTSKTASH